MVSISEQAAAVLYETIQASGIGDGNTLRLATAPEGFALAVDAPGPSDRVLSHGDEPVLLVDPEVEETLGDAIIEVEEGDGDESPRLVIRHME